MNNNNKRTYDLSLGILLLIMGLFTRFVFITHPPEVVFDEVLFGKFVNGYFTGQYFFDVHPPLGKLITGLGAGIGKYHDYITQNGVFGFQKIGNSYEDLSYFWWRFFPALAGSLIPLTVFLLLRTLNTGLWVAFMGGVSLILDNALLVHSRFILMDNFMILFGLIGLVAFILARQRRYFSFYSLLSGFFLGASISVKWTGLAYFAIVGMQILADFFFWFIKWKDKKVRFEFKLDLLKAGQLLTFFVLLPFLVYWTSFMIHFELLPRSGSGDAYMNSDFRLGRLSKWEKFIQLNQKMYYYNTTLKAKHPDASLPYQWILGQKPIYYWSRHYKTGEMARIVLMGNPAVWLFGLLGLGGFLLFWPILKLENSTKVVLVSAYGINFFPYFCIERVLFLYHYLSAFIFSVIFFWLVLDARMGKIKLKWQSPFYVLLTMIMLIGFVYVAPLSYGWPLSQAEYENRIQLYNRSPLANLTDWINDDS